MEKSAKSVAVEKLTSIRNLIGRPDTWTKGAWARSAKGRRVAGCMSPKACKWCLQGAYYKVAGDVPTVRAIHKAIELKIGHHGGMIVFNDDPSTTHADVLAVLDRAIELAKAEEAP